jgi:hypothetical protein
MNPISRTNAAKCKKKFLYYFPKGFHDPKYIAWERGYKWDAHLAWENYLSKQEFTELLNKGEFSEIASRAVRIETKTNLLFSFEKMALRDGIKDAGAEIFSKGLFDYVYSTSPVRQRFENFTTALEALPRKQTRVRTWPLQTVFGFIARPEEHIFLKPRVTQAAAKKYNYAFVYKSKPNWDTYNNLLGFAEMIRSDTKELHPRDMIDLQSFMWVMGSEEYPD